MRATLVVVACLLSAAIPAAAQIWAKGALRLIDCTDGNPSRTQRIPAPDGPRIAEVSCRASTVGDEALVLRVLTRQGASQTVTLENKSFDYFSVGFCDNDLVLPMIR